METINKLNAVLYVDVSCAACGKRMAMSNAHEIKGAYYCGKHYCYNDMSLEQIIQHISCQNGQTAVSGGNVNQKTD